MMWWMGQFYCTSCYYGWRAAVWIDEGEIALSLPVECPECRKMRGTIGHEAEEDDDDVENDDDAG